MKNIIEGVNDLKSQRPDLALEFHPTRNTISLETIATKSNMKIWWLGACGHEWEMPVIKRAYGRGCSFCSSRAKLLKGFNDFQTKQPILSLEWDSAKNVLSSGEVSEKPTKKVWWRCKENHSWETTVRSRVIGTGCPACAGNVLTVGVNDFATTYPVLVLEWDFAKNTVLPTEITKSYSLPVWWICPKDHFWKTRIVNRIFRNRTCHFCSFSKCLPGVNDLTITHPELLKDWVDANSLSPTSITYKSREKVSWRCKQGHEWQASVRNRAVNGSGCPACLRAHSKLETKVRDVLLTENLSFQQGVFISGVLDDKKIRREIDFVLDDYGIGIEVQDFTTHSRDSGREPVRYHKMRYKRGPKYHQEKAALAKKVLNVDVFELWEDEIQEGQTAKRILEWIDK